MTLDSAKEYLLDLCNTICMIWRNEDYVKQPTFFAFGNKEVKVVTTFSSEAELLPITGKPIRGTKGVTVRVESSETASGKIVDFLEQVFTQTALRNNQPDPLKAERDKLESLVNQIFEIFRDIPSLPERIFESIGYKHHEPKELSQISNSIFQTKPSSERFFLSKALAYSLEKLEFQAENWEAFTHWEQAVDQTLKNIENLASRTENYYDVVAFINAPSIDFVHDISLGEIKLSGGNSELLIAQATDELLGKLFDEPHCISYRSREKVETINSVLKYRVVIGVDEPIGSYLNVYPEAAAIMAQAIDVMRVIRSEDIGIQALEVFPGRWATPSIRKTYATMYQPEYHVFDPRRSYFIVEASQALSNRQIEQLGRLIPAYVNKEINLVGLPVAMQRFRDSQDRYSPYDPQSLLDIAIAFEAVFLNDTDYTQELSYRLSIRVARFLGKDKDIAQFLGKENDKETRMEIFQLIRTLYNLRSKLAHGSTLKTKDQEELQKVHFYTPILLREALCKFLEGQGPKKEEIKNWWRELELE